MPLTTPAPVANALPDPYIPQSDEGTLLGLIDSQLGPAAYAQPDERQPSSPYDTITYDYRSPEEQARAEQMKQRFLGTLPVGWQWVGRNLFDETGHLQAAQLPGGGIVDRTTIRGTGEDGNALVMDAERRLKEGKEDRNFFNTLLQAPDLSMVPFMGMLADVGGAYSRAKAISDINDKVRNGEPLSLDEAIRLEYYLDDANAKGTQEQTVGTVAADIIRHAPGFAFEFVMTGGLAAGVRGLVARGAAKKVLADATTASVGRLATYGVNRGAKTFARELADRGIADLVEKGLADSGIAYTQKAAAEYLASNAGKAAVSSLAPKLAASIRPFVAESLGGKATGSVLGKSVEAVADKVALSVAQTAVKRRLALHGATSATRRAANGALQWLQRYASKAALDWGTYGEAPETMLNFTFGSVGQAAASAVGIGLIEAPVKGFAQLATVKAVQNAVLPAFGISPVSATELGIKTRALSAGSTDVYDDAKYMAFASDLLEYVSENAGAAFGSALTAGALGLDAAVGAVTRKAAPKAVARYVGEIGGLFTEETAPKAGFRLGRLIERSLGTRAEREAKLRSDQEGVIRELFRSKGVNVPDAELRQVVRDRAFDAIKDPAARAFASAGNRDYKRLLSDAVKAKYAADTKFAKTAAAFRYMTADFMVRRHMGPVEFSRFLKRFGYDGFIEEMLEERYSGFVGGLLGLDAQGKHDWFSTANLKQAFKNISTEMGGDSGLSTMEQLGAEALGFALPMVMRATHQKVFRWATGGGGSELDAAHRFARDFADGHSSLSVYESPFGSFYDGQRKAIDDMEARIKSEDDKLAKAMEEYRKVGAEKSAPARDAQARHDEAVRAIRDQIGRQESFLRRTMQKNASALGIKPDARLDDRAAVEEIVKNNRDNMMMYVAYSGANANQEAYSSAEARQIADARKAAGNEAAKIGRLLWRSREASWEGMGIGRRIAAKLTGIAAAMVTGDLALAQSDAVDWALVDAGVGRPAVAALRELHGKFYDDTRAQIMRERIDQLSPTGATSAKPPTREEVEARMDQDGVYAAKAKETVDKLMMLAGARAFHRSDVRDQVIMHIANREGWKYNGGTKSFERDGEVIPFADFASRGATDAEREAHRKEAEDLMNEVSAATVRMIAQSGQYSEYRIPLGRDPGLFAFLNLPSAALGRDSIAMGIAAELAGFGDAVKTRRVTEAASIETQLDEGSFYLPSDAVDRIADALEPSDEDVALVAAAFHKDARLGTEDERKLLRSQIVGMCRLIKVKKAGREQRVFTGDIPVKDTRLWDNPTFQLVFQRRKDGRWRCTSVADPSLTGGKDLATLTLTDEELEKFAADNVLTESAPKLVITPVEVFSSEDPALLLFKLGLAAAHVRACSEQAADGTVDYSKVHPRFRPNPGLSEADALRVAEETARREEVLAGLYDPAADGNLDYFNWGDAKKPADPNDMSYRQLMTQRRNMCRAAYNARKAYMADIEARLRAVGCSTPNTQDYLNLALGPRQALYTCPISMWSARTGSQYVAVDFTRGQDPQSALCAAIVNDAVRSHNALLTAKGPARVLVSDTLKDIEKLLASIIPELDEHDAALVSDLRRDLFGPRVQSTIPRRTLVETIVAVACGQAARAKRLGYSATAHSAAFAIVEDRIKNLPSFINFLAFTDLILGGDGFSRLYTNLKLMRESNVKGRESSSVFSGDRGLARLLDALDGRAPGQARAATVTRDIRPAGMSVEFLAQALSNASFRNLRVRAPEGEGPGAKPKKVSASDFASIQKAILSAIDISKIDKALTGATDEEKNIELGRRIGDFFTQIVMEFQGKGEGRFEFGNAINRTVQGFLANTVKEIERLSKRVAELEEQLRTADDKSREELSSQLDPILAQEAQMMEYIREYADGVLREDWGTFLGIFESDETEADRRAAAAEFAAERNPVRAKISKAYADHAKALKAARNAEKLGIEVTSRDLHRELLPQINVATWWGTALARREEMEQKQRADEGGGDTISGTRDATPTGSEVGDGETPVSTDEDDFDEFNGSRNLVDISTTDVNFIESADVDEVVDSDGSIRIVTKIAKRDDSVLTPEAVAFTARAIASLFRATRGADAVMTDADFDELMLKLTYNRLTETDAEYVRSATREEAAKSQEGLEAFTDTASDAPTEDSSANNFDQGDRNAELLDGKELRSFLQVAELVSPASGRNLQQYINLLRQGVAELREAEKAAGTAGQSEWSRQLDVLHQILNPRAVNRVVNPDGSVREFRDGVDRQAYYDYLLKGIGTPGGFDIDAVISRLANEDSPLLTFFLSFIRGLDPNSRCRFMDLVCSSAQMGRMGVTPGTDGNLYAAAEETTFTSPTEAMLTGSFSRIISLDRATIERLVNEIRAEVRSEFTAANPRDGYRPGDLEAARRILAPLEKLFGRGSPMLQAIRSAQIATAMSSISNPREAEAVGKIVATIARKAVAQEDGLPKCVNQALKLALDYAEQAEKVKGLDARRHLLENLVMAYLMGGTPGDNSSPEKAANYTSDWVSLINHFTGWMPVALERARTIPARNPKVGSNIAVTARGLPPLVAKFVFAPMSDETSFASMAYRVWRGDDVRPSPTAEWDVRAATQASYDTLGEDGFREFFAENILPQCRQDLCWPDEARTPLMVKKIDRDRDDGETLAACRNSFDRLRDETPRRDADNKPESPEAARKRAEREWRLGRVYVPMYHADHSTNGVIQIPSRLFSVANRGAFHIDPKKSSKEIYLGIARLVNSAISLDMLGIDTKRSSLSCNESVGVSMRGVESDGKGGLTWGENRFHVVMDFALPKGANDAFVGSIFSYGYAVDSQALRAKDPNSRVQKTHVMSSHGGVVAFTKGCTVGTTDGYGRFVDGSVTAKLDEYIRSFRKGTEGRSTSSIVDRDAIKVGQLVSETVGHASPEVALLALTDPEAAAKRATEIVDGGSRAHENLYDYVFDRLADQADSIKGTLSGTELDMALCDRFAADGKTPVADADGRFRFTWVDSTKPGVVQVRRVTVDEVFEVTDGDADPASGKAIQVNVVKGAEHADETGKVRPMLDFSFVDNGAMSYAVANVSHQAKASPERMPRNNAVDILTFAVGTMSNDESKRLMKLLSGWGLLSAMVASDPASIAAAISSESVAEIRAAGVAPGNESTENAVAYEVFSRLRKLMNPPLNAVYAPLVSCGAVYRDGKVYDHSADPFFRDLHRGSTAFGATDRLRYGAKRRLGYSQINCVNSGIRYGWFVKGADEAAQTRELQKLAMIMETYSKPAAERKDFTNTPVTETDHVKLLELVFTRYREVERLYATGKKTAEDREDFLNAKRAIGDAFVDHHGVQVSKRRAVVANKDGTFSADKAGTEIVKTVFRDLFTSDGRFDRTAVDRIHAPKAVDASQAERTYLGGSYFGLPRTPSYNGSMWLQVVRASTPVTEVKEDDGTYTPGRDAAVSPDAQTNYILGCDHDGDKALCYMLMGDRLGFTPELDPGDVDPAKYGVDVTQGPLAVVSAVRDREVRRRFVDGNDLVYNDVKKGPQLSGAAQVKASNAIVANLADMARNIDCTVDGSEPGANRAFADTDFARPTKARPISSGKEWKKLLEKTEKAFNFRRDRTKGVSESGTGAHVGMSADDADKARGAVVALAAALHMAYMSGQRDDIFRTADMSESAAFRRWVNVIYLVDGISNATFDDVKEQICLRLGWTPGLVDVLYGDLLMGPGGPAVDEASMLAALEKYVAEIGTGRGMAMMLSADNSDSDIGYDGLELDRLFPGWELLNEDDPYAWQEGKGFHPQGDVSQAMVHDAVLRYIYGTNEAAYTNKRTLRDRFGIKDTGKTASYTGKAGGGKSDRLRAARQLFMAGFNQAVKRRDEKKQSPLFRSFVRELSRDGSKTPIAGYVAGALAQIANAESSDLQLDIAADAGARVADILERSGKISEIKRYSGVVNCFKADPGDARKMGRRDSLVKDLAKWDNEHKRDKVPEDVRILRDTLFAATVAAYEAGEVQTRLGRMAIASEGFDRYIVDFARDVCSAPATLKAGAQLVSRLFASTRWGKGDVLQREGSFQQTGYFLSALMSMPRNEYGTDVMAGGGAWDAMRAMSYAMNGMENLTLGGKEVPNVSELAGNDRANDTFAFQQAVVRLFSALYAAVSTSTESAGTMAALHRFSVKPVYRVGEDGAHAVRRDLPHFRLTVAATSKDHNSVANMLEAMEDMMGADYSKLRRVNSADGKATKCDSFILSVDNLKKLLVELAPGAKDIVDDVHALSALATVSTRKGRTKASDIASAIVILDTLEKSLGLRPGSVQITPKALFEQFIPLYSTTAARVAPGSPTTASVIDHIPGVCERLTETHKRLDSGLLDMSPGVPAGARILDLVAACNLKRRIASTSDARKPLDDSKLGDEEAMELLSAISENTDNDGNALPIDTTATTKLGERHKELVGLLGTARDTGTGSYLDVLDDNGLMEALHEWAVVREHSQGSVPGPEKPSGQPDPALPQGERVENVAALAEYLKTTLGPRMDVRYDGGTTITIETAGRLAGSAATLLGLAASAGLGAKGNPRAVIRIDVGSGGSGQVPPGKIDVNSPTVAASFVHVFNEAVSNRAGLPPLTVGAFMRLTERERRALVDRFTAGGFRAESNSFALARPSWSIDANGVLTLAGYARITTADRRKALHEYFHSMMGIFRACGAFTDADVAILRDAYGAPAEHSGMLFDEERAAEEFAKYARAKTTGARADVEGGGKVKSVFRRLFDFLKTFFNLFRDALGFSYKGTKVKFADKKAEDFSTDDRLFGAVLMAYVPTTRDGMKARGISAKDGSLADQSVDQALSAGELRDNLDFAKMFADEYSKNLTEATAARPGESAEDAAARRAAAIPEYENPTELYEKSEDAAVYGLEYAKKLHGDIHANTARRVQQPKVRDAYRRAAAYSDALTSELSREGGPNASALCQILARLVGARSVAVLRTNTAAANKILGESAADEASLAYHSVDTAMADVDVADGGLTALDLEADAKQYLADMDTAMRDPEFLRYLNFRAIDDAIARIDPAYAVEEVRRSRIYNEIWIEQFNEDPGRRAWLEQAIRDGRVEINMNRYGTPAFPNISIRDGNRWYRTTAGGLALQYGREMADAEAARREAEFNASTDPRVVELRKTLGSAKEVIEAASIVDEDAAKASGGPVYTMLQAAAGGVMEAEAAGELRNNAQAKVRQGNRWFEGILTTMRDRERAIARAHRRLRENLARKGIELAGFECTEDTYNLVFAAMPLIGQGRKQLRRTSKVSAGYIQVMGKSAPHITAYDIAGALRAANLKPFGAVVAEAQAAIIEELRELPESEWGQTTAEDDATGSATWRTGWKLLRALGEVLANSDATLAAADGVDWNRAVDDFFKDHIVGVRVSRYGSDRQRGPFWDDTTDVQTPIESNNQKIYALGAEAGAAPDAGRELRQKMIGLAVDAVCVAAAQVKFARELGLPVTAPNNAEFPTGHQTGPSFAEVSTWLGLGRHDVESEDPIVAEWNEPVFIAAHINSWMASTVQSRMGTCELKKLFMRESQALRGHIDVLVNAVNRVDQMFGVDRRVGAKIGKLRRRKATHVWGESGFIEAAGENAPEYEGIDNARGFFRGRHVGVSLDQDDARVIDLFMKCAQLKMRGGDYVVTGCQIRFNGASFDRKETLTGTWRLCPLSRKSLSRESLEKRFRQTQGTKDIRQLSSLEIALRNFDQQWGAIAPELTADYRARFVDAVVEAQTAWVAESKRRAGTPSAVELNDFIIRRLADAGLVVATSEDDAAKILSGETALSRCTLAFKVADVEAAWDKTAAYRKLVEAGRDRAKLTMDWVIDQIKPELQRFNRAVADMPWLTRGDARYLNGSGSLLRHFSGNGLFMMDALKAERDRESEAATQLARHEATYMRMLRNTKLFSRAAVDMSGPMLDMVHDYFGTPESGEALRRALRDGEYGVDTPKSARTGLTVQWYTTQGDVAKAIYAKLLDTKMRILEGRELTGKALQDEIAVSRMIRAYEGAAESGQPLSGGFGLTDEAAYRLNGLLPASMTIGHMAIEATAGVQAALYFRSTLINMLSTPGPDGYPLYFANPSAEAVEASGIPDEVWEAIARHNVKALSSGQEESIEYDITKTGVENARLVYEEAKRRLDANRGTILGHRYTQMAPEDMAASKSLEGLLVRAAESDVNVGAEANNLFTGGEAMGYARQLFQTAKVLGSGCHWVFNSMQHIMAWSKALKVSLSAFFPLATRWESPTGAVGALATILSNLSPKTARRYGETLQKISTLWLGRNDTWMDETFLGFKDILGMMDTDDPFLADLIMYAESLGITMTSRVANPSDGAYSYVQKDMESLTKFIENAGKRMGAPEWSKHAADFVKIIYGSLMERQGEKAFTYAMNATKLAVAAQVALRLKHEAMRAGRAFDPVRDLSKFAEYVDSEVGGVNPVRYAWATPGFRYLMNLLMFSWQWTRTAWEAGGGGVLEDMVFGGHHIAARQRSYMIARWARMCGAVMFGFPLIFQMTCKALALALAGIDDPDDPWFTWDNDRRIGMSAANIRPLLKALAKWDSVLGATVGANQTWDGKGVPTGPLATLKRNHPTAMAWLPMFTGVDPYGRLADQPVYVHMGKQGWEFWRWFTDFGGQAVSKLSMALQALITATLGQPLGLYDRGPANLSDEYAIDGEKKGFFRRVIGGLFTDIIPQMVSDTFTPFTVSGLSENTDAGLIGVLMPVQRGTSYTNIRTRIEVLAEARIRNDAKLYLAGRENMRGRKHRLATVGSLPGLRKRARYEEADWKDTDYQKRVGGFRDDVARGIVEDARRNHMSKATLAYAVQDALTSVRAKIVGEWLRAMPKTVKDDIDEDHISYLYRCLYRSGYTHSNILDRLRDHYGTKSGYRSWADVDPKLKERLMRIDLALGTRPLSDVRREVPGAADLDY